MPIVSRLRLWPPTVCVRNMQPLETGRLLLSFSNAAGKYSAKPHQKQHVASLIGGKLIE